jgi:hypothetical protein
MLSRCISGLNDTSVGCVLSGRVFGRGRVIGAGADVLKRVQSKGSLITAVECCGRYHCCGCGCELNIYCGCTYLT